MKLLIHSIEGNSIAELQSDRVEINSVEDSLDLMGNSDYQGARKIIVKKEHLCSDFFDLKTGIAGEILQKFSNYRMQLAIVGDFSGQTSKSLRDFIFESNKTGRILFVPNREEAIRLLSY